MLSETGCRNRRKRLWERVPPEIEWVVVGDPRHVNYLSSFWVNPISASLGQRSFLLLKRSGESIIACDESTNASAMSRPHVDRVLTAPWYGGNPAVASREHALMAALKEACSGLTGKHGLFETEWLPADVSDNLRTSEALGEQPPISLSTIIRQLRRQKDQDELEILKICMDAGKSGHDRAREVVTEGMSEIQIFTEIQSAIVESVGYPVVVYGEFRASSPNDIHITGAPTRYRLESGDMIILDFSVVVAGYRSDFTNTLCVGKPTPELQNLMDLCCEALEAGEQSLRPGVPANEVYRVVADRIAKFGLQLQHHAGHGLGLEHPEAPAFIPESKEVVGVNEVVAIEPGVYVDGVGGVRVEHNFVTTNDGSEPLSSHELGF